MIAPFQWRAVLIVMAGTFMAVLDSFIVVVAEPAIQAELGASTGQLQWILAGRLVPRYGRRVLEIGAIVLALGYASTVTVLVSGLPFTPEVVIPTLMLQSAGGGLLITPSLNAVLARIDPADTGVASGVLSTAQQVGGALGVAIIGVVFFGSFRAGDPEAAAYALAMSSLFPLVTAVVAMVLVFLLGEERRETATFGSEQVS